MCSKVIAKTYAISTLIYLQIYLHSVYAYILTINFEMIYYLSKCSSINQYSVKVIYASIFIKIACMSIPGSLLSVTEFHHTLEQLCSLVCLIAPNPLVPVLVNIQVIYKRIISIYQGMKKKDFYQTKQK